MSCVNVLIHRDFGTTGLTPQVTDATKGSIYAFPQLGIAPMKCVSNLPVD
jgi:hypothetical protein